jgi:hypothetical protein
VGAGEAVRPEGDGVVAGGGGCVVEEVGA